VRRVHAARTIVAAIALAISVGALFYAVVTIVSAQRDASELANQSHDEIAATLREQQLVVDMETSLRGYLLTRDKHFLEPWDAAERALPSAKTSLVAAADDSTTAVLTEAIHADIDGYIANYGKPLAASGAHGLSRTELAARLAEGKLRVDRLRKRFASLIEHERQESAQARVDAARLSDRSLLYGTLGLVGSVLLIALFAGHQLRFVLLPMRRVGHAARKLAAGDLTARVPQAGSGEVAELGRAFNSMADSLESARDELESQNAELESQQIELETALDALEREKERIERLYRVGRAISSPVELEDVCVTVVAELASVARAQVGAVYVFTDAERDAALPVAALGVDVDDLEPVRHNVGLAGRVLAERRTLTASHGKTGLKVPALGGSVTVAHELHLPLMNGSDVVGVLTLARLAGGPFADADLEQLDYLGGRAAGAIASALTLRVLRDQAALNQAVLETAGDAFITSDSDDVILAWNPAAERMFGWTAEEAIGRRLADTVVPERYLDFQTRVTTDAGTQGKSVAVEARHRDGHEFPIELTVSSLELNGKRTYNSFIRDITPRRRSERYTRAQLAVTRVLAESTTLGEARERVIEALGKALGWSVGLAWLVDHDAGLMRATTFWSDSDVDAEALREFAFDSEFKRGEGLPGRVWASREPVWIEDLRRDPSFTRTFVAEQAGLRSAISLPVINDETVMGTIEFFAQEPERPDPELLTMLATIGSQISQFSKRKRVELEADRLKDEFFALVSHELRTPLTSIIGYLELVLEEPDALDPTTGRFLQVVERNARRLHRLVGDLLFVAQVEAGRLSLDRAPVSLRQIVDESIEAARPRAEENGVVLAGRTAHVGDCDADPDRLAQMLDNLVSNAIKFTPAGGRVDIELMAAEPDRAIVEVRDTGVGIPAAEQGRMFQRFFRSSTATESAIPGVGLGLAISRAIAEAHGGTIRFTSEEGRGATFQVDLPLTSARPRIDTIDKPKEVVL
jgi:PAS domain S-box-containing protein